MKQFDSINQIFSPVALCEVIASEHQPAILESCNKIIKYLKEHEQITELPGSINDVAHAVFFHLDEEIRRFFQNEKEKIFPGIRRSHKGELLKVDTEGMATYKENHLLILRIVKRLRQLMCNYVLQPEWSKEFRDCIVELYCLESKIYKWIEVEEELLFPQLVGETKTMTAVC